MKTDNLGTSAIITRSSLGDRIIKEMNHENYIHLKKIDYRKIIKSQRGILKRKKIGIGSRIIFSQFLYNSSPEFGMNFEYSLKGILGAVLIFFNSMFSQTRIGKKILEIVPCGILIKYRNYVYRFGSK